MPSSVVRAIDYEPDAERLLITFVSGRLYAYEQVPPDVYEDFSAALSKGEYFNAAIRDRYPYTEAVAKRRKTVEKPKGPA